jgi:hypothetical protein
LRDLRQVLEPVSHRYRDCAWERQATTFIPFFSPYLFMEFELRALCLLGRRGTSHLVILRSSQDDHHLSDDCSGDPFWHRTPIFSQVKDATERKAMGSLEGLHLIPMPTLVLM